MDLSRNIIKRYVAVATPEKITSNSETVYGTVVSEGEELFVMIDGSSILTPVSSNIDLAEGDRVLVLVKNHEATVIGSPTSPTARLEELRALEEGVSEFEVILADKVGTGELVAMQALIEDLEAKDVEISGKLTANEAKVEALEVENETINGKLTAYQADIEELQADNVTVTETLTAHKADIDSLQADNATITDTLTAHKAVIDNLDATYATIDQLDVEKGRINNLEAGVAEIGELAATHATIEQLDTEKARITNLEADVGDIDTLIFGSASGTTIQTSFANAVIAQLGDAQIKSAMIESLSADKLTAGDIITNNVRVLSEDGKLLISDETIQISDDTRVRVQIGKDASGDYSISIWDADGNLMFSEGGITDSAIKDAIIRDDMVSENANIAASKLDISSLFTEINNSTQTINANRVLIDTDSGTLDVAFTQMSSDVDDLSGSVESQGTKLNVIQGQIDSKVWQQDIDNATGELETQYSELSQTVDGISATVAQHTTDISTKADSSTVTAVTDRVTAVEADLSGFKTTVSETYVDSDSFEDLETTVNQNSTSITSLATRTTAVEDKFGDYSTTEEMTSAIEQKAESITSSVSATYATKTALATTDTKASNAATAASNAQTTANTAKTNAATAQSTAEAAQQAADDAQDDVDALTTRVSTAETKIEQNSSDISLRATKTELTTVSDIANAAQATADDAAETAATAESTANTANSTANTANSTANSVKTNLANNYYTKTQTDAQIKVSADSITQTVSETYQTIDAMSGYSTTDQMNSAIEQKANSITQTVSSTYATKTELAKKTDDFNIDLYNGTAGNPKGVKCVTVNYSNCTSETGVLIKISMVSGHGNGTSYTFLQDVVIRVDMNSNVEVDNSKHYGAETPTYDGEVRQYGDIFWVIDTTNKVVDFYCLMGQYSHMYQTPLKRLNQSTGGTITQHTSCTVYSSGTKVWANNSDIALTSDLTELETQISQTNESIALCATKTELTTVSNAASAAQSTADTAKANAATAQSTADTAKANAATAQSTADTAKANAATAQTTANTANSTANSVKTDLANNYYTKTQTDAQIKVSADNITSTVSSTYATKTALATTDTKATNAATAASNAQSTADTAKTNAATAQTTANNAATAASNAQNAADAAQETADSASEVANVLVGDVESINKSITSLSTEVNQTDEQWRLAVQQTKETIAVVDGKVDGVQSTISTYETWFSMDDDGLTIGKTEDGEELPLKVRLDNDSLDFLDNNTVVAYVSNEKLMINAAEVKGSLDVGGFRWIPRDNGNMGLIWIGG